jgi:hypothetical protein
MLWEPAALVRVSKLPMDFPHDSPTLGAMSPPLVPILAAGLLRSGSGEWAARGLQDRRANSSSVTWFPEPAFAAPIAAVAQVLGKFNRVGLTWEQGALFGGFQASKGPFHGAPVTLGTRSPSLCKDDLSGGFLAISYQSMEALATTALARCCPSADRLLS